MIRRNQRQLNGLNALTDGVLVFVSYLIASWFWLGVVKGDDNMASLSYLGKGMGLAAGLYAVWTVFVLASFRAYRTARISRRSVSGVLAGNTISILTAATVLYLFRLQEFSRGVLGLFYLITCTVLVIKRAAVWHVLRAMRAKGYNLKHVLVVGGGALAKRYVEAVRREEELGLHVVGQIRGLEELDSALEARLYGDSVDEVVIALEPEEAGRVADLIRLCDKFGTKTSVVPFYNDVIPSRPMIGRVGSVKLIELRTTAMDEPLSAMVKRGFDIAASLLLIVLLSPLMLCIAIAVKLDSPGPVLFCQKRVGLNKKIFRMYKFRSMRVNDAQETAWSTQADERRTRLGFFLRKTSLDELPQLFNTLRGDMSLVGPRPEIPYFVEQFREMVPLYMVKYQVRPGMTGWAQIHGLRGDTSIPDRVEHDLWYIENWSFGLDLYILLRTALGGMINAETLGETDVPGEKREGRDGRIGHHSDAERGRGA